MYLKIGWLIHQLHVGPWNEFCMIEGTYTNHWQNHDGLREILNEIEKIEGKTEKFLEGLNSWDEIVTSIYIGLLGILQIWHGSSLRINWFNKWVGTWEVFIVQGVVILNNFIVLCADDQLPFSWKHFWSDDLMQD